MSVYIYKATSKEDYLVVTYLGPIVEDVQYVHTGVPVAFKTWWAN